MWIRGWTVAAIGGIAVLLAAIQPSIDRSATAFWEPLMLRNAMAVESFDSLQELAISSDLVIVAKISSLNPGRDFGDEADTVHYAAAVLAVDRVLAGELPSGPVVLEIMLPHGEGAADVAGYAERLPTSSALFFLRSKGLDAEAAGLHANIVVRERPFHRLVTPDSLILAEGGRAVPAPGTEAPFLLSAEGEDFEALVQRVDAFD
jgi:hypothetical protein